jgi:hypothetical protein
MDVDNDNTEPVANGEQMDAAKEAETETKATPVPKNEDMENADERLDGDHQNTKDHEDKVPPSPAISAYCVVWKALEDIDESIALIDGHFASGGLCSGLGGESGSGLRDQERCSICTKGGVLVGPYGDESFYVHEHCLLFSQQVVADVNGFIDSSDVRKALRKGVQTRCMKCKGFGATVDCCALVTTRGTSSSGTICRNAYHYECANADPRVALDHMTYECFCSTHSRQRPSYELKPIVVPPGEYFEAEPAELTTTSPKAGSRGNGSGARLSVNVDMSTRAPPTATVPTDDLEEDDRSNSISMMSPRLFGGSQRSGSLASLSARRSASRAAAAEKAKAKRIVGHIYVPPKRLLTRKPKRQRGSSGARGAAAAVSSRGNKRPRAVTSDEAAAEKVGKHTARDGTSSHSAARGSAAAATFAEEDVNAEDAELTELRQASRLAMGLRETKKARKSTLSSSDTPAVTEATEKSGGKAASKGSLRRRKAGSKKKATIYPGGTPQSKCVPRAYPRYPPLSASHSRTLIPITELD